jgi:competence protein ComEC
MEKKKTKHRNNNSDPLSILLALGLIAADVVMWYQIIFATASATMTPGAVSATSPPRIYFLDVGQGDSELVVFPGNIKIMTDAGPDNKVLQSLASVMPQSDTYIDLAIVSHPELDHFGGYNSVLDHYRVGAFIYNGRDAEPGNAAWAQLRAKIKDKNIPLMTLGQGDVIHYATNEIDILSPDSDFAQSGELNDTGLVEFIKTPQLTALFTADTGFNVENVLLAWASASASHSTSSSHLDLHADVLKIAHHGSKYASGDAFLRAVSPKVAVIGVGAKNTFGQPSKEALARIASSTKAQVFRTDQDGTVAVTAAGGAITVLKEK